MVKDFDNEALIMIPPTHKNDIKDI
jgi:hypothetical protein